MVFGNTNYSPNILIYLDVSGQTIRLSDVMHESATLHEAAELPPHTKASLVFSIDGVEEREEVVLYQGISKDQKSISFSYSNPVQLHQPRIVT